jgi:phosphonate transport system substrate-binding protein
MKKFKLFFATMLMSLLVVAGCAPAETSSSVAPVKETLTVVFVPSRDNATLVRGISFLPAVLKTELSKQGYNFKSILVYAATSYEAVGEALDAGTADVGLIPGGTYAVYSTGGNLDVALTATRGGLSKDSDNPKDWNDGLPTTGDPTNQVTYYRSLGIAGVSPKGRELAAKVNAGGTITWEDLQTVKIGVQGPTSSAGRIYPTVKFLELYDKSLSDLPSANIIPLAGYGAAAAALASGQVDVAFGYADFRRDYVTQWTSSYGRTNSVWDETDVVFVTPGIYNDTVTVSKVTVDAALKTALQTAFKNLVVNTTPLTGVAATETMFLVTKDIFKVYSHEGYKDAKDSDYENERTAQKILSGK